MSEDDQLPPLEEEWVREEPWEDDPLATFESEDDHLEAQLRAQDKRNRLDFSRAIGQVVTIFIYFAAALLFAGLGVLAFHYLTPFGWLEPDEVDHLQSMVFSGTLGAVVSMLAKRYEIV